jgi:DNA-binding transcriptional LysR family regulator
MAAPVRSAEIAELRAFCAAVDLGSLGRAARLLRLSQPALSKRLRTLEDLAGARLLDRSPRGVSPTPAGSRLYMEARKLLAQAETVEALMTGLSTEEAPVRLAASHTIAEFVLPSRLVELESRRDRHLSVELFIANSVVVHELVGEGRAEVGIAAVDPGARRDGVLSELAFCEDEVVVAVPEGHPWAFSEEVAVEDFLTTPMIMRDPGANTRRTVEAALAAAGLSLCPPLAEVGSTSAARAAAVSEGAPLLLSSFAVQPNDNGLVARRVRGLRFPRSFALLVSGEESLKPSARALVHHLLGRAGDDADTA